MVGQARQGTNGRLYQPMAGPVIHLGDETKTAIVFFKGGAVETARTGWLVEYFFHAVFHSKSLHLGRLLKFASNRNIVF